MLGTGHDLEDFYLYPSVIKVSTLDDSPLCHLLVMHTSVYMKGMGRYKKMCWAQAFQEYVIMILTRVNTITGVAYKDDPTIFALELANEPHTSDNYETKRGVSPGLLVKGWMKVIVQTIRVVDKNHMVRFLHHSKPFCHVAIQTAHIICRA